MTRSATAPQYIAVVANSIFYVYKNYNLTSSVAHRVNYTAKAASGVDFTIEVVESGFVIASKTIPATYATFTSDYLDFTPSGASIEIRIRRAGSSTLYSTVQFDEIGIAEWQSTSVTNCYYAWGSEEGYRFGFNGMEKDNEVKGSGNSLDFGARIYDSRLGRWMSMDPLLMKYPDTNPYNFVLNSPMAAIDPDGRLVVFVNGYRACLPGVNVYREVVRDDKVFKGDKLNYWSGVDKQFMTAIGDDNSIYADGDAPTLTKGNQVGFDARVGHGRKAGQDLVAQIKAGTVTLKKNDKGEVIETIKIVAHSMGYAYSIGMVEELQKAGYKVEVMYALAPENPTGGNIPANVDRSVQYGSGPDDPWYQQDWIAPQEDIKNVDENAYIPDGVPKGPYDSHAIANYGKWIFNILKGNKGFVAPRNDTDAACK